MFELLFLILGLIGLVLGTELIIRGSLNIAEHFKISQLFIGLTILTVYMVNRQKKPKSGSLQLTYRRGVGFNNHVIFDENGTGGYRLSFTLDFNKAHPTRHGRGINAFQVAEVWNIDLVIEAGLK